MCEALKAWLKSTSVFYLQSLGSTSNGFFKHVVKMLKIETCPSILLKLISLIVMYSSWNSKAEIQKAPMLKRPT